MKWPLVSRRRFDDLLVKCVGLNEEKRELGEALGAAQHELRKYKRLVSGNYVTTKEITTQMALAARDAKTKKR